MKIHIPKFEPMLKANEHLAHEAFDIVLGDNVVEVVRCRDCKHYEIHRPKVLENCERNGHMIPMKPDDFCSYGERRCEDG